MLNGDGGNGGGSGFFIYEGVDGQRVPLIESLIQLVLILAKGSQLSCVSENPFHLTRDWSCWHLFHVPRIHSTSHSGCPSIRSGMGS